MGAGEGESEGVGVGDALGVALGVGEPGSGQPSTIPLNRAAPLSTTYSTSEVPRAIPAGALNKALVPGPSKKALILPPTRTFCVIAPPEPSPAPVSNITLPPARVTNMDRVGAPLPPTLTRVAKPEGFCIPRAQVERVPLGLAFLTAEL